MTFVGPCGTPAGHLARRLPNFGKYSEDSVNPVGAVLECVVLCPQHGMHVLLERFRALHAIVLVDDPRPKVVSTAKCCVVRSDVVPSVR